MKSERVSLRSYLPGDLGSLVRYSLFPLLLASPARPFNPSSSPTQSALLLLLFDRFDSRPLALTSLNERSLERPVLVHGRGKVRVVHPRGDGAGSERGGSLLSGIRGRKGMGGRVETAKRAVYKVL